MLGTNDLLRGASAEEAGLRMEGLLSFIKPRLEGAKLLLVCPPPMERGSWVPTDALVDESKKLGRLYREAAARQEVFFADAGDWDVELIFDGVHFSLEGHAAFARGLSAALEKLL